MAVIQADRQLALGRSSLPPSTSLRSCARSFLVDPVRSRPNAERSREGETKRGIARSPLSLGRPLVTAPAPPARSPRRRRRCAEALPGSVGRYLCAGLSSAPAAAAPAGNVPLDALCPHFLHLVTDAQCTADSGIIVAR